MPLSVRLRFFLRTSLLELSIVMTARSTSSRIAAFKVARARRFDNGRLFKTNRPLASSIETAATGSEQSLIPPVGALLTLLAVSCMSISRCSTHRGVGRTHDRTHDWLWAYIMNCTTKRSGGVIHAPIWTHRQQEEYAPPSGCRSYDHWPPDDCSAEFPVLPPGG